MFYSLVFFFSAVVVGVLVGLAVVGNSGALLALPASIMGATFSLIALHERLMK